MMSRKGGIIKPSYWLYGLTLLALASMAFLLLFPLSNAGEQDAFERVLLNLLHVPLFAVIMILVRFLQTSCPVRWSSLWFCALVVFLIGALFEVIQNFIGRSCSIDDLILNLGGILLACALLLRKSQPHARKMRLVALCLGLGILFTGLHLLVVEVLAVRAKYANFPKLLDPEYPNGLWQAQGGAQLKVVKGGEGNAAKGLEVQIAEGSYEGLRYIVPKGVKTKDYSRLVTEFDNAGEEFELGVRLDGEKGVRQYRSILVPQGRSILHTEWVSNREDGKLRRVVLFTGVRQPARKFLLLSAHLQRKSPTTVPADP